jgi:hypothetical protein
MFTVKFWILLIAASLAQAQPISGRFYPEKKEYIAGEPIFVILELTNSKSAPPIQAAIGECWINTRFVAPTAPRVDGITLYGCSGDGVAGDCGRTLVRLLPGELRKIRLLVKGPFRLDSPGVYPIRVWHTIDIYPDNEISQRPVAQEFKAAFEVALMAGDQAKLTAAYAPVLRDLRSSNDAAKFAAIAAITQYSPAFLEEAILGLGGDAPTAVASIGGLKRLGTTRAKDELAEFAAMNSPEAVRQPAIHALGELGDPAYCQLMLDIARNSPDYSRFVAMRAAGALCEQRAVPILTSLLTQADKSSRFELVYALGNSHTRDAVPILIPLLADSDENVRKAASEALKTLTHRDQQNFAHWWSANSTTAKIYSIRQCRQDR